MYIRGTKLLNVIGQYYYLIFTEKCGKNYAAICWMMCDVLEFKRIQTFKYYYKYNY
jgi:hypothetical protein